MIHEKGKEALADAGERSGAVRQQLHFLHPVACQKEREYFFTWCVTLRKTIRASKSVVNVDSLQRH